MTRLLTEKEVRAFFGVGDKDFVTKLVQKDLLPRIVLGKKCYRYEQGDVLALLDRVKNDGLQLMS